MRQISSKSLEELQKKIKKKFELTGFPTEEQVTLTLINKGWCVFRNTKYYDEEENKFKETDITAIKSFDRKRTQLMLLIECKKQEKYPWVFLESSKKIGDPLTINFVTKGRYYDYIYLQIEKKFHQHYYYDAPSSTVHLNPFYFFGKENETKNGDRNPVEKAVNQTLRGFLESLKREVEWIEKVSYDIVLIYPIIVLNGNLISYSINSSGELNSGNLRNHIIYLTNISIKKPYPLARRVPRIKPVAIDIVTLTYLEKFLEILETKSLLVL